MLLRASSDFAGEEVDLNNIYGTELTQSTVAHAALLTEFAETASVSTKAADQQTRLAQLREQVRQTLGDEALVDSAAVIAMFNAVVKVADATGIPLEPYKEELSNELRAELDINRFRNT